MRAGDLDRLFGVLPRESTVKDGDAGFTPDMQTAREYRCCEASEAVKAAVIANNTEGQDQTVVLYCRDYAEVKIGDLIVYDGAFWEVTSVSTDRRKRMMTIVAKMVQLGFNV